MMGDDHPSTPPVYTHKYAYRGLIPMERARKELGEDLAANAKLHVSWINFLRSQNLALSYSSTRLSVANFAM